MPVLAQPTTSKGILVPEIARLIARPSDLQDVAERVVGPGGVEHQVHRVADRLANCEHRGSLPVDGTVDPSVDLEGRVSERVPAANGELRVVGRRGKPAVL